MATKFYSDLQNFDDVLSNNYKLYYWKDTTIELYLQKVC